MGYVGVPQTTVRTRWEVLADVPHPGEGKYIRNLTAKFEYEGPTDIRIRIGGLIRAEITWHSYKRPSWQFSQAEITGWVEILWRTAYAEQAKMNVFDLQWEVYEAPTVWDHLLTG